MKAAETIELVVFELGGVRYGADLTQVIRLDFFDPGSSVGAPLGKPKEGTRALIINAGDGRDWCLAIDTLHGVRSVPVEQLRRLPSVALGGAISIGAWLDGDQAVLLVDLKAMTAA